MGLIIMHLLLFHPIYCRHQEGSHLLLYRAKSKFSPHILECSISQLLLEKGEGRGRVFPRAFCMLTSRDVTVVKHQPYEMQSRKKRASGCCCVVMLHRIRYSNDAFSSSSTHPGLGRRGRSSSSGVLQDCNRRLKFIWRPLFQKHFPMPGGFVHLCLKRGDFRRIIPHEKETAVNFCSRRHFSVCASLACHVGGHSIIKVAMKFMKRQKQ